MTFSKTISIVLPIVIADINTEIQKIYLINIENILNKYLQLQKIQINTYTNIINIQKIFTN